MPGTIRLHRVLKASPEKVYKAFLDADAMANGCRRTASPARCTTWTPRSAAPIKMSFTNFSTGNSHSFGGEYLELVPHERIRYTDKFDDPNLPGEMSGDGHAEEGLCAGPSLNIVQEGIPDVIPAEACYLGWQESLVLLAKLVEAEIPARRVGWVAHISPWVAHISHFGKCGFVRRLKLATGYRHWQLNENRRHDRWARARVHHRLLPVDHRALPWRKPDSGIPHILINSLDVDKGIAMLNAGKLHDLTDYLAVGCAVSGECRRGLCFHRCEYATPRIRRGPAAVRDSAAQHRESHRSAGQGARPTKVGLFGTGFTMRATSTPRSSSGQELRSSRRLSRNGISSTVSTLANW